MILLNSVLNIFRFLLLLIRGKLDVLHLVGHSLGAHAMGKVSKINFRSSILSKGLTHVQALRGRGNRSLLFGGFILKLSEFSLFGNIIDYGRWEFLPNQTLKLRSVLEKYEN